MCVRGSLQSLNWGAIDDHNVESLNPVFKRSTVISNFGNEIGYSYVVKLKICTQGLCLIFLSPRANRGQTDK